MLTDDGHNVGGGDDDDDDDVGGLGGMDTLWERRRRRRPPRTRTRERERLTCRLGSPLVRTNTMMMVIMLGGHPKDRRPGHVQLVIEILLTGWWA